MGGWEAPYGIELEASGLSTIFLILVSSIGFISILYGRESVEQEIKNSKIHLFYAVFMLCFTGLLGIILSNDIFNIYVFLEISSLSTYALIAMGRDKQALLAAFEYLIIGTIGATFYLIGVGFIYAQTGTLNITDLGQKLPMVSDSNLTKAALIFIITGLAIKSALFPLHNWLIRAYSYSPNLASVFLSGTSTKVTIYLLIKVIYVIFNTNFMPDNILIARILTFFSIMAILFGSVAAILQTNIKKMLAYSSVAQIGYIIVAISLKSQAGLVAAITQIISHSLAKTTLFMAAGEVGLNGGSLNIESFKGLGKSMPLISIAIAICFASIVGMPITLGFIAKWYLLEAALKVNNWMVAITALLSSIFAIIYAGRVIENIYFRPSINPKTSSPNLAISVSMLIPTTLMIFFGINARPIINTAEKIAQRIIS
jgi:multicomponent Na+:H+ antiporter subunit D